MGVVTAKQLKNRTGEVLRRVGSGETLIVTVRGVPVAQFAPVSGKARAERSREASATRQALIRAIAGKYRGVGTVDEFLAEKRREIGRER